VKERLFEPLVTGKPEGTGLGLSVSREVARQHGGEIRWVRDAEWTQFVVELPVVRASSPREL
jgi:two-component system nitrogen regulation sensor histidine kinase GlnL